MPPKIRYPTMDRSRLKNFLKLSIAVNALLLLRVLLPLDQWSTLTSTIPRKLQVETVRECGMCQSDPILCEALGEADLAKTISYSGTNDRLRRVLTKMKTGQPFNVGVVGGSVSKGQGLMTSDNLIADTNMHRMVFNHLNDLFPAANGVEIGASGVEEGKNGFINGAQGGVGSDYFAHCFNEHIPEDVDLVLVELAINDEITVLKNQDTYEILVRGLLDLPSQPAVLNLQQVLFSLFDRRMLTILSRIFALKFSRIANGGDLHSAVSQLYDLPVLTLRNALLPHALANESKVADYFVNNEDGSLDLRHMSWRGHDLMGRVTNAYIDSQLCELEKMPDLESLDELDTMFPKPTLPRLMLSQKYDEETSIPPIHPNCRSTNSQRNKLTPSVQTGWREWNWKEKVSAFPRAVLTKTKHYLVADKPGSTISFAFTTAIGTIKLFYLRSAVYNLGSVECWVDADRDRAKKLHGYWKEIYNIGKSEMIRDDLLPGEHVLHCELLDETQDPTKGHEFRIISLMSI